MAIAAPSSHPASPMLQRIRRRSARAAPHRQAALPAGMINRDSVSGETHGRMRRARPPTSASRSTPKATSRMARASMCDAACRISSIPTASPRSACWATSGARAAKSRGDALADQRTMACGSQRNFSKMAVEQDGRCYASVMGPQHAPQRFLAEPGAAAFIGHDQPPAADTILAAFKLSPSNGAGAGHHHAAIAAAVGSDTSGLRIGRNHGAGERMLQPLGGRQVGRLAGAGERQAGGDPPQAVGWTGRPVSGIPGSLAERRRNWRPVPTGYWLDRQWLRPAQPPLARIIGRGIRFRRHQSQAIACPISRSPLVRQGQRARTI